MSMTLSAGSPKAPASAERITIEGEYDAVLEHFQHEGWTDGLPIVPPTEDAVARMLAEVDRDPSEVVAALPPSRADVTVFLIAVNAVMAGCRPEYLPVVIAAIEAIAEPKFNLYGIQATTNPVAPLIVVNGPLARELGFNGKGNCMGPGVTANATVGRALRLCLLNIAGGAQQSMDKSTQGQPGKYTMCIAENEEESPWEPYHVEKGFAEDDSTVSVFSATGTHNVLDLASKSARGILRTFASSFASVGMQNVQLGGGPLIMLCPEHAQMLAAEGFTKDDVRHFLYESARVPVSEFPPEVLNGMVRRRRPKWFSSENPNTGIPFADCPGDIEIVVAGGPGPHSSLLPSFGEMTTACTRRIVTRGQSHA